MSEIKACPEITQADIDAANALWLDQINDLTTQLIDQGFPVSFAPFDPSGRTVQAFARRASDACATVQRERDAWKGALIDELIVAHIYTKEHEYDPKKALADAITWNVRVAMDPAASSDAAALIDRGRQEVLRDAVELARFAWDHYPNPDTNHVDYRVEVARKAKAFLARYEASK